MNNLSVIPCFFHPTTVLIVDDNEGFLVNMTTLLNRVDPHIIVKTFSNPDEALEYVDKVKSLSIAISPFTSEDYLPSSGTVPLEFNISHIYKQATNSKIFNELSVAVVDYNMSHPMTGADFCTAIAKTHIKRIMLTGEGDAELGVGLLNDGTINKFLIKTQPDLEEKLAQYIYVMKKAYFQDLSAPLLRNLSKDMCSCLSDPAFVDLFHSICKEINIISYYLIDFSGSFLLIDSQGKLSWLIVKTKTDIEEYVDFIQDAEVEDNIITMIKHGEKIPYFYKQKDYVYSVDASFPLEKHLYPAKKLVGEMDYYYCVTDEVHDFPLKEGITFKAKA